MFRLLASVALTLGLVTGAAAKQHIDKAILDNPGIYPDEATMKRLFTNTAYDERSQRAVTRLWTRVKTGR